MFLMIHLKIGGSVGNRTPVHKQVPELTSTCLVAKKSCR